MPVFAPRPIFRDPLVEAVPSEQGNDRGEKLNQGKPRVERDRPLIEQETATTYNRISFNERKDPCRNQPDGDENSTCEHRILRPPLLSPV